MMAYIIFGSLVRQVWPPLSYLIRYMEVSISVGGCSKCSGGLHVAREPYYAHSCCRKTHTRLQEPRVYKSKRLKYWREKSSRSVTLYPATKCSAYPLYEIFPKVPKISPNKANSLTNFIFLVSTDKLLLRQTAQRIRDICVVR